MAHYLNQRLELEKQNTIWHSNAASISYYDFLLFQILPPSHTLEPILGGEIMHESPRWTQCHHCRGTRTGFPNNFLKEPFLKYHLHFHDSGQTSKYPVRKCFCIHLLKYLVERLLRVQDMDSQQNKHSLWELDCKEGQAPKNWCFQTVVLGKTVESPLDCKEIKPVNLKWSQSWMFTRRTDAEAPKLWPPGVKSRLIRKDPDAVKDWR